MRAIELKPEAKLEPKLELELDLIQPELIPRLWTVAEYHQMAVAGILNTDEKVELIAGQIIKKMSPQLYSHATSINLTRLLLEEQLGRQILVRDQQPITLNNRSEPEPDLAVVIPGPLRYFDHHPSPAEIYLIIEVADTTLKKDRGIKAQDYASSGINDYWVINLSQRQLHVLRNPSPTGYQNEVIYEENELISPLAFPNLRIRIGDLLPPIQDH